MRKIRSPWKVRDFSSLCSAWNRLAHHKLSVFLFAYVTEHSSKHPFPCYYHYTVIIWSTFLIIRWKTSVLLMWIYFKILSYWWIDLKDKHLWKFWKVSGNDLEIVLISVFYSLIRKNNSFIAKLWFFFCKVKQLCKKKYCSWHGSFI